MNAEEMADICESIAKAMSKSAMPQGDTDADRVTKALDQCYDEYVSEDERTLMSHYIIHLLTQHRETRGKSISYLERMNRELGHGEMIFEFEHWYSRVWKPHAHEAWRCKNCPFLKSSSE